MNTPWYRQSISSKEFKTGLKEAPLFQIKNLLGVFGKEEKEGQKVKSRLEAVKEEIQRRKEMKVNGK